MESGFISGLPGNSQLNHKIEKKTYGIKSGTGGGNPNSEKKIHCVKQRE